MSENEQLRAELAELREAVIHLALDAASTRAALFSLPRPERFGANTHRGLVGLICQLEGIPENTANIHGAPWMMALEKRTGLSFDELRSKQREVIDRENSERACNRMADEELKHEQKGRG